MAGQIGEDRLLAVAAFVVFYGLSALFPAITAWVSLYGLFANASSINDHLSGLGGILPGSAVDIVPLSTRPKFGLGSTPL